MQTYWLMDSDRKEKKDGGKKDPWAQTKAASNSKLQHTFVVASIEIMANNISINFGSLIHVGNKKEPHIGNCIQ